MKQNETQEIDDKIRNNLPTEPELSVCPFQTECASATLLIQWHPSHKKY